MDYEIRIPTPEGWQRVHEGTNQVTLMPADTADYASSGLVPSVVAAASPIQTLDEPPAQVEAVLSSSSLHRSDEEKFDTTTLVVQVRQIDDRGEAVSQICATTRRGGHELAVVATARDDQLEAIAEAIDLVTSSPADFRAKD